MRWTPVLFLTACTLNGKPLFSGGGGASGTAPASGGASSGDTAVAAPAMGARCPNGKKYFLGAPEEHPGHGVHSVALADVNGDGKLDIITGNSHYTRPAKPHLQNVATMLNKGGAFADMVFTPVAKDRPGEFADPDYISAGDLDGDGHVDIMFSSPDMGGSNPLYAIGNGDGTFAETMSMNAFSDGGAMLIADLNGDKKNDVIIHDHVWLNSGTKGHAKFPSKVDLDRVEDDERARVDAVADLDGDGAPELVAKSIKGVVIYVNDGNGGFTRGAKIQVEDSWAIAVGDLDGDGKPDLVVQTKASLAVIMNKGGGKFGAPIYVKLPEGLYSQFMIATDLNGDGRADVVIPGSDYVAVLMNDGKGGLAAPIKAAAGKPYKVVAGDLTGDKVQSLVVVGDPSSDEDKSKLFVLRASCR